MTNVYRNRLLLLCPAAIKDAANAAASQVMGPGNDQTFRSGYSATGNEPATHYAACSVMQDEFIEQLAQVAGMFPSIRAWVSGPADFSSLAAFASQVAIGDFDPHEVLHGLDLVPVS